MSAAVVDYVQAATTLRCSLEEAADALAHADLERLLACELRIHAALTHLSTSQFDADARVALTREITLARAAVERCRRLGGTLDDFARLVLSRRGLNEGYGRTGVALSAGLQTMHRTA